METWIMTKRGWKKENFRPKSEGLLIRLVVLFVCLLYLTAKLLTNGAMIFCTPFQFMANTIIRSHYEP